MHQVAQGTDQAGLASYFEHVGIGGDYRSDVHACEICGGTDFVTVCEEVEIGRGAYGHLPVQACTQCGYVMQNPRFEARFYQAYYEKYYRTHLFGSSKPDKAFMADQVKRGQHLLASLQPFLPLQPGRFVDVGSSAGGMMVAFHKAGWSCLGTDPDQGYVAYGKQVLNLDIIPVAAEDMVLPAASSDVTIIMGSLEHVTDVNRVLALCHGFGAPGSLLLIEGRAYGFGLMNGFFSHNHRRYLTAASIALLMGKHGFEPIWTTHDPICGPTRPGAVYCLGKRLDQPDPASVSRLLMQTRHDRIDDLLEQTHPLRARQGQVAS